MSSAKIYIVLYHEIKVSPTLSRTVSDATKILQKGIKKQVMIFCATYCIKAIQWRSTGPTNTDTRIAAAQSLACSVPRFCSTRKPGKHSRRPFCNNNAANQDLPSSLPQSNKQPRGRIAYNNALLRSDPIILAVYHVKEWTNVWYVCNRRKHSSTEGIYQDQKEINWKPHRIS